MIESILDTDLYKFTQQQAVLDLYPHAQAKYKFFNRGANFLDGTDFIDAVRQGILGMSRLSMMPDEVSWLAETCPWFKPHYIEYLRNYQFDPKEVNLLQSRHGLEVEIKGPWHRTILWEVPLMAVISEAYFRTVDTDWGMDGQDALARKKCEALANADCHNAEFGTRRRRNYETQRQFVDIAKGYAATFNGTSNVHLAKEHGVRPIGTKAHEWTQAIAVLEGMRHANRTALDKWHQVYNGNLGIALTDTFGSKAFFEDFDLSHAKLWDGLRHDSGCPFEFTNTAVKHYRSLGVPTSSKTIVFSDSLDVSKAKELKKHCCGIIPCSFGIGTHFSNDFKGSPALNMVIKLISINGLHTVKLSDDAGKEIGDPKAVEVAKWVFGR